MDEAARNARDEQLIINLELHDRIKLLFAVLQHAVKLLRLGYRPGKPVKYESVILSTLVFGADACV